VRSGNLKVHCVYTFIGPVLAGKRSNSLWQSGESVFDINATPMYEIRFSVNHVLYI
jgi:hypothetical protein